jgi:hypothetical protein
MTKIILKRNVYDAYEFARGVFPTGLPPPVALELVEPLIALQEGVAVRKMVFDSIRSPATKQKYKVELLHALLRGLASTGDVNGAREVIEILA